MAYSNVKDTKVHQKSFQLAMEIFDVSKSFPSEEKYSLTGQIRRSSRSVTICLLEAYRKKIYPAHFVSKLSDCDMENSETSGWLEFALACGYISKEKFEHLFFQSEEVGKMLGHMIKKPEKY